VITGGRASRERIAYYAARTRLLVTDPTTLALVAIICCLPIAVNAATGHLLWLSSWLFAGVLAGTAVSGSV
jgi:integral membrane sensor domain MASE1